MAPRSKRIVIVAHHYPPHVTGVGMVAHDQAKRLVAAGHHVTVITSRTRKDEKTCVMDGVNVERVMALNVTERWGAPFPIFSPRLLLVLLRSVKNADIVHVHDAFYMSSFGAALCARIYRKPIVITQHVAMIPHPSKIIVGMQKVVYATTGALIFRWSNLVLTLNDRVEKFLVDRGVPLRKIVAFPNGVDTELFCPVTPEEKQELKKHFGMSLNKKIALFIGRFVPKKGFDKVLAAESDRYQLVFAGGDRPPHKNNQMIFLGKLPQVKVAQLYQAADVFILPSHGEGFPLSIQEAMASGLPVITTNDEGYKRYNLDERLVYLIDNPTNASVRHSIESIINDEERMQNMAAYSHRYAKANFSWPLIVARLERIYDELLQATENVGI